jgi:hypothetical protein
MRAYDKVLWRERRSGPYLAHFESVPQLILPTPECGPSFFGLASRSRVKCLKVALKSASLTEGIRIALRVQEFGTMPKSRLSLSAGSAVAGKTCPFQFLLGLQTVRALVFVADI